jgi:hypothetical protein
MKKYFSYCPDTGFHTFYTLEEAQRDAAQRLEDREVMACEDGWRGNEDQICCGELTDQVGETKRIDKDESVVDEEGYDEVNDLHWNNNWDSIIEYKLLPLKEE